MTWNELVETLSFLTQEQLETDVTIAVNEEYFVCLKETGEKCSVAEKDGKTLIKIYHRDRIPGDYLVVNPFKENSSY